MAGKYRNTHDTDFHPWRENTYFIDFFLLDLQNSSENQ